MNILSNLRYPIMGIIFICLISEGVAKSHKKWSKFECHCSNNYWKPVCASDSQTYNSVCLLHCAMDGNRDLQLVYKGPCEVPFTRRPKIQRKPKIKHVTKANPEKEKVTKTNAEEEQVARKHARTSGRKLVTRRTTTINTTTTMPEKCITVCACSDEIETVCTAGGRKFDNHCKLDCYLCINKLQLNMIDC